MPLYPGFLAYLSSGQTEFSPRRSRYFLGVFALAGLLTMILLLAAVGIFAFSFTATGALGKLLWFELGYGWPLLLLSSPSGAYHRWITRPFAIRTRLINTIGGLLLIGIGIYDLATNWELIQTFL